MAEQIKALGINYNFAPSVDVNNNSKNPIIGNRSFGEDPENVYQKAKAYLNGHKEAGIFTSVKHFPGHGDTDKDSHKTLPVINGNMKRLNEVELYPFKKLIDDGVVESVMTSHLSVPSIDKKYPSSFIEIHPELIIHYFLNHKYSKKTVAGQNQRLDCLNNHFATRLTLNHIHDAIIELKKNFLFILR